MKEKQAEKIQRNIKNKQQENTHTSKKQNMKEETNSQTNDRKGYKMNR